VIRWARPVDEPHLSKRELAESAGWDPGEDYGGQPVDPNAPLSPRIVRWVHQGSTEGCDDCGRRCDYCGDRTCTKWGPAPDVTCGAHFVCEDCAPDHHCADCQTARKEAS
jgi:hypothetical protein